MNAASGPCWRVEKSWITGSKMRTSNTSLSFLRRPSLEKIRPLSACESENFRPTTNPTPGNKQAAHPPPEYYLSTMPQELILKIHDITPPREVSAPIGRCSIGRSADNDVV